MKYCAVFILFSTTFLAANAQGSLSLESFLRAISPRRPELHRVRRIADARGDPSAVLDTAGLVEQYGYPAEQHSLTTRDGYNLVFFRVPGSPKSPPRKGKPVVFLQHGMLASSDCFVLMGPGTGLVYMLVDAGYDVWLGNIRGNSYCRSNTRLTVDDKEFWDFSWHDMALNDVASTIDYVLEFSGHDNLLYIGHSMGTTMAFVLLSEKPEYNAKIRLVIALAPAAYWKSNPSMVWRLYANYAPMIKQRAEAMGIYNVLPQMKNFYTMIDTFCGKRSRFRSLCLAGLELITPLLTGLPADGFDTRGLMGMLRYFPAGVSLKTLMHYQQFMKSDGFRKYDNGPAENWMIYGTETPPLYDVWRISAPVALIYGNTDVLAVPENVIEFSKQLPNLITCEAVPADDFNHLDFIVSPHAKYLLYNRILELLSMY